MKAAVHPLKPDGISKRSSKADGPVLLPNSRNGQIEKYGWPETVTFNVRPAANVALFFGAQQTNGMIPIYLANATGTPLSAVFASDVGFIECDEAHKDTLPHVRPLGTVQMGVGVFLDSYCLDLAGTFLITYAVLATAEEGSRYSGSVTILFPPRDGWLPIEDWSPVPA